MSLHTDRRPRSNRTSSPEQLTRWIPRALEQLEDRLTPSVTLSNNPTWIDVGPNNVTGGEVSGITNNRVIGAIEALTADLSDITGNTFYAGGANGGVWKTINGLNANPTWVPLTDSFPSLSVSTISINPDNNQQILAGIAGSADGSYSIRPVTTAAGTASDRSTVLDSRGPARGDLIGALYSADGGSTWKVLNNSFAGQNVVGVAVRNTYMLVATNAGLYRSTNGGTTFTAVSGTLPAGGVYDLAADPGAPSDVVASATWAAGVVTITTTTPHTLSINQSVIIAGINPSGYNGTFTVTGTPTANSFTYNLAINPGTYVSGGAETANSNADPLARNRFYVALRNAAGTGGRGVFRTDNGGVTWGEVTSAQMQIGANTTNVQIAVFDSGIITNNVVYVAVENNLPTGSQFTNSQSSTTGFDYGFTNRLSQVSTISWSPNQGGVWTRMDAPRILAAPQTATPPNFFTPAIREEQHTIAFAGLGTRTYVTVSTGGPSTGGVRHHLRDGDIVDIEGVADQGNGGTIPRGTIISINDAGQNMVNGYWYVAVVDEYTFVLLWSADNPNGPNRPNTADFVASNFSTGVFLLDGAGNPIISNGGTWAQVLGPNAGERSEFFDLVVDPNSSSTVYLGTDRAYPGFFGNPAAGYNTYTGSYWRGNRLANPSGFGNAVDESNQWVPIVNAGASGTAPAADSRDLVIGVNGDLFASTGGGIYRRANPLGNGSWTSSNGNLGVSDIFSVAYDTLNNIYIAGTIDTQGIAQSTSNGLGYTSVIGSDATTTNNLRVNFQDQANVFKVLTDNSRLDNAGNPITQTVRYYVGTNFGQVLRQTVDNAGTPTSNLTQLLFASPLNTTARFAGLTRDSQGINANENVHIAMALNQNDQRRGIFGYNGLYEDADPSGTTPTGSIINDITPVGMTGHVESLLYGGKRGGVNYNQVAYVATSTGQLWVRGEFGPTFTLLNTGFTGPIFAFAGDPDDYRHIFVVQGTGTSSRILESKNFGATFVDITDNLIGPATADGTAGPGRTDDRNPKPQPVRFNARNVDPRRLDALSWWSRRGLPTAIELRQHRRELVRVRLGVAEHRRQRPPTDRQPTADRRHGRPRHLGHHRYLHHRHPRHDPRRQRDRRQRYHHDFSRSE